MAPIHEDGTGDLNRDAEIGKFSISAFIDYSAK